MGIIPFKHKLFGSENFNFYVFSKYLAQQDTDCWPALVQYDLQSTYLVTF